MKFTTPEEVEKYLLQKGYKKHIKNFEDADFFMQKQLTTKDGKQFYYELFVYDFRKYNHPIGISLMPKTQFKINNKSINAINITGILDSDFEIEEIENYYIELFDKLDCQENT